jgi:hypothetical protein
MLDPDSTDPLGVLRVDLAARYTQTLKRDSLAVQSYFMLMERIRGLTNNDSDF